MAAGSRNEAGLSLEATRGPKKKLPASKEQQWLRPLVQAVLAAQRSVCCPKTDARGNRPQPAGGSAQPCRLAPLRWAPPVAPVLRLWHTAELLRGLERPLPRPQAPGPKISRSSPQINAVSAASLQLASRARAAISCGLLQLRPTLCIPANLPHPCEAKAAAIKPSQQLQRTSLQESATAHHLGCDSDEEEPGLPTPCPSETVGCRTLTSTAQWTFRRTPRGALQLRRYGPLRRR
ncbi:hypothetical protein NDU88_005418 [Pleurodeles waltl]|uniref:Uncharacterized protein n=1 Tax=Pleurodeles waltl TaxID=8319 RepID=A0AAV7VLF9_PLEWA|nr:hypothetical protein NDU88_005418 [Pleurodeles waltl]